MTLGKFSDLSEEEFVQAMYHHFAHNAPAAAPLRALFEQADTNGSGSLQREELKAALRGDKALQQALQQAGLAPSDVFNQLDADGDGDVTVVEFVDRMYSRRPIPSPEELVDWVCQAATRSEAAGSLRDGGDGDLKRLMPDGELLTTPPKENDAAEPISVSITGGGLYGQVRVRTTMVCKARVSVQEEPWMEITAAVEESRPLRSAAQVEAADAQEMAEAAQQEADANSANAAKAEDAR